MKIIPFRPEHLDELPGQYAPGHGVALAAAGPAYSAVDGNAVIACAGLMKQWDERAIAWAIMAAETGRHMLAITRAVKRGMALHPFRRIEAAVRADFEAGHRWMEMLGFSVEAPRMEAYTPDGADAVLYAKVV